MTRGTVLVAESEPTAGHSHVVGLRSAVSAPEAFADPKRGCLSFITRSHAVPLAFVALYHSATQRSKEGSIICAVASLNFCRS